MEAYGIWSPLRMGAFLAQCSHETTSFTQLTENLNYSVSGLMKMWKSRFPTVEIAIQYAHNPEKIANFVYPGRYGNGDTESGDGWTCRGRGPLVLTFKDNYREASLDLFKTEWLLQVPDHVALSMQCGAAVAARYWYTRKCNDLADRRDFVGITKAISGGETNLDDRLARTDTALEALA